MQMLMVKTKKKSEHYVNNKDFYQALVEYKKQVDDAKEKVFPNQGLVITLVTASCVLPITLHTNQTL